MSIFYSPSKRGFFAADLPAPIPEDAVPVTPARHRQLIEQQEAGGEIVPDAEGKPVIRKPGVEDLRIALLASVKREAARRIKTVSPAWRQLNDLREPSDEGAARFAAIDAVREASGLIASALADCPAKRLAAFPVRDNSLWPQGDRD